MATVPSAAAGCVPDTINPAATPAATTATTPSHAGQRRSRRIRRPRGRAWLAALVAVGIVIVVGTDVFLHFDVIKDCTEHAYLRLLQLLLNPPLRCLVLAAPPEHVQHSVGEASDQNRVRVHHARRSVEKNNV